MERDNFNACERVGRDIVEGILDGFGATYEETEDPFDAIDIFCTASTGGIGAIEVKYRSAYTSTQIDAMGGHILEQWKYDNLMDAYRLSGYTPTYWMAYPDKVLVWDLRGIVPKWVVAKYPSTTAVKGEEKNKMVTYLDRDDAAREY